jgi:hypothetical protein
VILPWLRTETPTASARLNTKLDDLARPRRLETARGEPPVVAATGSS